MITETIYMIIEFQSCVDEAGVRRRAPTSHWAPAGCWKTFSPTARVGSCCNVVEDATRAKAFPNDLVQVPQRRLAGSEASFVDKTYHRCKCRGAAAGAGDGRSEATFDNGKILCLSRYVWEPRTIALKRSLSGRTMEVEFRYACTPSSW